MRDALREAALATEWCLLHDLIIKNEILTQNGRDGEEEDQEVVDNNNNMLARRCKNNNSIESTNGDKIGSTAVPGLRTVASLRFWRLVSHGLEPKLDVLH